MIQLATRALAPGVGLEVLGVDLAALDEVSAGAIYALWQHEPLLLFRRQTLTEREMVDFSRRFGELDHIVREDMYSSDFPEIAPARVTDGAGERDLGLG